MRNKKKSVFKKYFYICASIIIISFTFLGAVLLFFASSYFKQDKKELLLYSANEIAQQTLSIYNKNEELDVEELLHIYAVYDRVMNAQILLVDINGRGVTCTKTFNSHDGSFTVPRSIMDNLDTDDFYEMGKLDGLHSETHYTAIVPVLIQGQPEYYVIVSMPAAELVEFLKEIFKMFILACLIAIIGVFIMVYFAMLGLVRPLREMSAAARQYAKEDFSRRIPPYNEFEFSELSTALNEMASNLASSEQMRRSFIGNVSHELRTPMTSIAGFIDGILDGTIPKSEQSKYLMIVSSEVKRLSRLVRSMLNLSRIDAGEMKLSKSNFDVVEVVLSTIFSFEQQLNEKKVDIRGLDSDKVLIHGDSDLIHQVIYNLIENAVKFVDEGGYIEFSFRENENNAYISIKNSGTGIEHEDIPRIFDRFYKTDKSRSQDKSGVGLGLFLVRSIIKLHGGDIIVESVVGEFCEFTISIPNKNPGSKFIKS
ncbi:MAG: HAMP domain-containing histidine kinase [Clostridiales bacterium]|nr:HAMP domain-containing histidine kinase [Clostridiales bacterium]